MVDVFVERLLDGPVCEQALQASVRAARGCFDLHRVEWQDSVLAADGQRMICRFRAADAESVRMALRQAGIEFGSVWSHA